MSESAIAEIIAAFYNRYDIIEPNKTILLQASTLRGKYNFSYWDSLIASSALQANAEVLYTEDMHNGLIVEGKLTIVNPLLPL